MPSMLKYALRYAPLLILALLLIPLHIYMMSKGQPKPALTPQQPSSPYNAGSALYAVTMSPNGEAWAVGGSFSAKPGTRQFPFPASGLILHYANNAWTAAPIARPLSLPLLGVSLDSPHDGWAVGWNGILVHYDGTTWSTVSGPPHFNQNLLAVAMLSVSNGWAVGYSGSILHYDGKRWIQIQSLTQFDLHAIAMLSAQEGWAVGDRGTILHFHNGTWTLISPSPTNSMLRSVSVLSSQEAWAVGDNGTILHFRNGIWERVYAITHAAPAYQYRGLFGIAMDSLRSGWIIGDQHLLTYSSEVWMESDFSVTLARNSKNSAPQDILSLYSIATSPGGDGWAVGRVSNYKTGNNALIILRYRGGTWHTSLITM